MTLPSTPRERAINLPPGVTAAILCLAAIQLCREFLPATDDVALLLHGAFFPAPWSVSAGWLTPEAVVAAAMDGRVDEAALAGGRLAAYVVGAGPLPWTPLTYALLHGSWTHLGLNGVWLAAFGTPVVRRIGHARAAILAVVATLGGAAAHWIAHPAGTQPLIGASAAVSGLMGAAAFFIFDRRPAGEAAEPASFGALGRDRSALLFLLVWFVVNLLFAGVAGGLGLVDGAIAWEAHIGGLLAGLLLFPAIDRTAGRRAVERT